MKRVLLFFSFLLCGFILQAQKVGLVLSGGGAKGMTHIGIIRALEENRESSRQRLAQLEEDLSSGRERREDAKKNLEDCYVVFPGRYGGAVALSRL